MRSTRLFPLLLLLVALNLASLGLAISEISKEQEIRVEQATEQEAREVTELANAFMKRMRETRDVASLKDLYLDDFMRRQITAERASLPAGHSLMLIPSVPVSIETDLLSQVSQREWERFYSGNLNLRYFFVLSLASNFDSEKLEKKNDRSMGDSMRKLFRPKAFALLQSNPFLTGEYIDENAVPKKYTIETLEELRDLISTLEQATAVLRKDLLESPPEHTSVYRRNLVKHSRGQDRDNQRMISPDVYGTDESRLGFPKGTRFFHLVTTDSLFELWLVKTDAGMKIVWARVYPFN